MNQCHSAPLTYWLIQDARGAPSWLYYRHIYATGRQLEQTQNQETALKFISLQEAQSFINQNYILLQTEWIAVKYLRYSKSNWARVQPNENT